MGGRALKSTYTRRYEKKEYLKLTSEVLRKIRRFFYRAEIPRYYHTKESFGDMDVLVSMKDYNGDIREFITTQFKPNEIYHNGNCWSFDYKEFQIVQKWETTVTKEKKVQKVWAVYVTESHIIYNN